MHPHIRNNIKMIELKIKIKIPQWKDFTKWFWDQFCFPRRKIVTEYFEWYSQEIKTNLINYLFEKWNCGDNKNEQLKLEDLELHMNEIMKTYNEKIIKVMYDIKK